MGTQAAPQQGMMEEPEERWMVLHEARGCRRCYKRGDALCTFQKNIAEICRQNEEALRKFPFNPKLGIDNPALCLGEDTGSDPEPEARFCVLRKDPGGSFGFSLQIVQGRDGHVIYKVVPGGPAHLGGLRDGDLLLQINGEYVHEQEHLRVVQKVKSSGSRLSLAVLDEASYAKVHSSHKTPASVLPKGLPDSCPRPRLCLIRNEGRGFGFTASATGGVRGTFLLTVEDGGPAHKAGVPPGARLLEVNAESVISITLSQLTKKLQSNNSRVVLLVLEASAWDVYEYHGITPTSALADTSFLPYRTRKLHLVRGPEGYGFLLRQEKCLGESGQYLRELDPGLPAEVAGMREGDRLLGVNGHNVEGLEHEDIVCLIQASGKQVTLIVISNEGDRFYREIGISPLLFYEGNTDNGGMKLAIPAQSASTDPQMKVNALPERDHKAQITHTEVQRSEE
ncbi:Na(+)/H(+) exchange regulatory cofactor NHE-RF4 [Spea bombifrons]|uniref:Na(+)/H(+) exchange regulatory cofactor NHE-RF4 n=1 Tax=Spea bombifrons TaxID=233779 RepID=UPI00234A47A4|nr:Na(+)/H(+) exchange regulatory cofactor NHE-RF4 [Spea bombifrons]